ncbi:MAG: RES family NAD+ phosphorylase [Nitrospiraceae bacterium]
MRVWRLCSSRHAPADGEGARLTGGRWNRPGTAVVYTSATLSLAVLEMLVHVDSDLLPLDLIAVSAEFPSQLAVRTVSKEDLPKNWRAYPAPESTQALGTVWAQSGHTAVLSVPSVFIPEERNYLLNPAHPNFHKITWSAPHPFQ